MEVLHPKPIETHSGDRAAPWAHRQLEIARSILDNPGGGLLFATQTIGQVKAGLHEQDAERWAGVVSILDGAEDAAIRREFAAASRLITEAQEKLSVK